MYRIVTICNQIVIFAEKEKQYIKAVLLKKGQKKAAQSVRRKSNKMKKICVEQKKGDNKTDVKLINVLDDF